VFDKTGTLTTDRIAVRAVRTRAGFTPAEALALAGALARHSLHPASRAIAAAAEGDAIAVTGAQEHAGQGVEAVLPAPAGRMPRRLRLGSAPFCGLQRREETANAQVHLADDAGWLATFDLDETLRPGAMAAVAALRGLGVQLEVLSGDQAAAVQRLAARAGIPQALGRQTPQDKLAHVARLQQSGRRVAMVGDGMNDGPVLARADVSIALGEAVPVAQVRSDFIIQGGRLDGVAAVLHQARRTHAVVRQNLAWAAAYNAVSVPLAIAGLMPPWLAGLGMAASSLLVVLNAARLARLPATPSFPRRRESRACAPAFSESLASPPPRG
jgi:P-type Cu2+ transporter